MRGPPLSLVATLLLTAAGVANAGSPPDDPGEPLPDDLTQVMTPFVTERTDITGLIEHLDAAAADLATELQAVDAVRREDLEALLRDRVRENLAAKALLPGSDGEIFPLTGDEIRRTVIEYEAFKIEAYVTSGVFPKRYFGYFDGKWDTAGHERTLALTTHECVGVINEWLRESGDPLRINDAEVAVTWIAEGGALLLRENQDELNSIHPVYGVGLDDIASGTAELAGLVGRLDAALGTDLSGIVGYQEGDDGEQAVLQRSMTFEESIAGTALMWVWEKRIAQRKLRKEGRPLLHDRPLDEQFILGSLVYNSGLIHSAGREFEIRDLRTADQLKATSDRNAHRRPELNLVPPAAALAELLSGVGYRDQQTSWLAVYHVLQRYGGWLGLQRFSDTFDETGAFRMERWTALGSSSEAAAGDTPPASRAAEPSVGHPGDGGGTTRSVWLLMTACGVTLALGIAVWRKRGSRADG